MQYTVEISARREKPLRCPKCGGGLSVELLVVDDEAEPETLLVIDCSNGDYHAAATQKDITELTTNMVMERLR